MNTDIASLDTTPGVGRETVDKTLTPSQLIWRRFRKHRMAVLGMIGFGLLLLFIIVGSIMVSEKRANAVDLKARLGPPTATYWMETSSDVAPCKRT